MAITRADFLRLLPLVTEEKGLIEVGESGVHVMDKVQLISISLFEEADPEVASLLLPRLRVRIEFFTTTAAIKDFMFRFDRAFQRGGG